eukprot:CAMPEP_0185752754 /NCGR_PEP_ID=MMETSP1174-20130828/11538_1 /TAXON_ID=35687 /ORGANISM="Dictyocha speculum, Strain CCMP1381" /LENGTH=283 /DNA_ID=CAMNT_0028430319 /DNA_START=71 /DNA_END=923 /DNA_ORIENTATION=+
MSIRLGHIDARTGEEVKLETGHQLSEATGESVEKSEVPRPHTPLMRAIQQGDTVDLKRLLLEGGMADASDWIDAADPVFCLTPLMFCALCPDHAVSIAMGEILVKSGAKTGTTCGEEEGFPLFMAGQEGNTDFIKFLVQEGADVNQAVAGGSTALWIAAQNGHAECVALLLKAGATVDAPNKKGVTPLSVAVHQAHSECVGALVAGGGDPKRVSDLVLQKEAGPLSLMIQSAARKRAAAVRSPRPDSHAGGAGARNTADPSARSLISSSTKQPVRRYTVVQHS